MHPHPCQITPRNWSPSQHPHLLCALMIPMKERLQHYPHQHPTFHLYHQCRQSFHILHKNIIEIPIGKMGNGNTPGEHQLRHNPSYQVVSWWWYYELSTRHDPPNNAGPCHHNSCSGYFTLIQEDTTVFASPLDIRSSRQGHGGYFQVIH